MVSHTLFNASIVLAQAALQSYTADNGHMQDEPTARRLGSSSTNVTEDFEPPRAVKWFHNRPRLYECSANSAAREARCSSFDTYYMVSCRDFDLDQVNSTFPTNLANGLHGYSKQWAEGTILPSIILSGIGIGLTLCLILTYILYGTGCCHYMCRRCRKAKQENNDDNAYLLDSYADPYEEQKKAKRFERKYLLAFLVIIISFLAFAAATFKPVYSFDSALNSGLDSLNSTRHLLVRAIGIVENLQGVVDDAVNTTEVIASRVPAHERENTKFDEFQSALKQSLSESSGVIHAVRDIVKNMNETEHNGRETSNEYGRKVAYAYASFMCFSILVLGLMLLPVRCCSYAYKSVGVPLNVSFLLLLWVGTALAFSIGLVFSDFCMKPNQNMLTNFQAVAGLGNSTNSVHFYLSCNTSETNRTYGQSDGVLYQLNATRHSLSTTLEVFADANSKVNEWKEKYSHIPARQFSRLGRGATSPLNSTIRIVTDAIDLLTCYNIRVPIRQMTTAVCKNFLSDGVAVLFALQVVMTLLLIIILVLGLRFCRQKHPGQVADHYKENIYKLGAGETVNS